MPILDLHPALPTAYRLRLGHQVRGDKGLRPAHLAGRIRVTSPYPSLLEQIAVAYGGTEPAPWASPDGPQVETVLPAEPLVVAIVPGQSLSQWWEHWNAGGCDRRCDGEKETLSGEPCLCPPSVKERRSDPRQWCQPVTRLSVLLPRLRSLATGRLDTHGVIAAQGIAASLALAQQALDQGVLVRATLSVRMRGSGAKQYVWPELVVSSQAVELGNGGHPELAEARKELPSDE